MLAAAVGADDDALSAAREQQEMDDFWASDDDAGTNADGQRPASSRTGVDGDIIHIRSLQLDFMRPLGSFITIRRAYGLYVDLLVIACDLRFERSRDRAIERPTERSVDRAIDLSKKYVCDLKDLVVI